MTKWPSPGKLNLFLYINGRRADGYHELQTLFQFLDWGDELSIELANDGQVVVTPQLPDVTTEQHLVWRAAMALAPYRPDPSLGAHIDVDKRLPMGGGVGGGSSNAATTLVALNTLWNCGLSQQQLANIGLKLGADVPIFIAGHAAFAEGVGEKLTEVTPCEKWYLVILPSDHVSTAMVFNHPALTRNTPKRDWVTLTQQPWSNDCEQVVCELYPNIANAIGWLLQYAPARLTGTGGCVFAEFASKQQADAIQAMCPYPGFVTRGLNRSPLLTALQSSSQQR